MCDRCRKTPEQHRVEWNRAAYDSYPAWRERWRETLTAEARYGSPSAQERLYRAFPEDYDSDGQD